jgi:TetR/AcrR family transcriptional regulator, repressor for neighboring sulfatase
MAFTQLRLVGTTPPVKKKRRPSLSKEASQQRLIEATVHLLKAHTVADLSVRQIANEADVNHGLVHSYFGSKGSLLIAVAQQLLTDSISILNQNPQQEAGIDQLAPELEQIINILLWLMMTGEDISTFQITGALVQSVSSQLVVRDKISAVDSEIAAVLSVSISLGGVLYRLMQSTQSHHSVQEVPALWKHLMQLLADNPFQPTT